MSKEMNLKIRVEKPTETVLSESGVRGWPISVRLRILLLAGLLAATPLFAETVTPKITLETCNEDDMDGYCWWELAVQDKDFVPCSFYDSAANFLECFEGVAKLRKPTEEDCAALEKHNDLCRQKLKEIS